MNLLIIRIYLTKYYDLFFLLIIVVIASFVYLYNTLFKNAFSKYARKIVTKIKSEKGSYLILSLLLLFGFIVRLYKINNPIADWHSFRQADTASVTRLYLENGLNLLFPKYHDLSTTQSGLFNPNGYRFVEFPIYNFFHLLLYKFLPFLTLEVTGRILSIIYSLISGLLIFLIVKRFTNSSIGLLSTFFYIFIPYNIYFTRVILPEPMAIAFSLASLLFFIKFVDGDNNLNLIVSSLFFAVSLLIKPYSIFYVIPILFLAYKKYSLKGMLRLKKLVLAGVISVLPFILWRIWINQHPEGIPFWKWTLNGDNIRFKPAFWYWLFGERIGKLILGYWGLTFFSMGVAYYKRSRGIFYAMLLGLFAYLSIFATANVRHDYYQVMIMPVISIFTALGVYELLHLKGLNTNLIKLLIVFSFFIMFVSGASQIKEFYKVNHPEIISAGKAVDKLTPKDALVIAAYNGDTAFLYQTKRRGWPVVDRPINELIEKGAEYYVSVNLNHPQTMEFMNSFEIIEKTNEYVIIDLKQKK